MFKKDIAPGAKSKVKSSVQRAIRTKITETYPLLAPHIDEIIPKKSQLDLLKLFVGSSSSIIRPTKFPNTQLPKPSSLKSTKLRTETDTKHKPDRVTLYALDTAPLFFQHMDDPITPHLRIVHQFPNAFPRIRIDRGAIRFVLSGATLMAPGLTSAGGRLPGGGGGGKTGSTTADDHEGTRGKEEREDDDDRSYDGRELEEGEVVVVEAEGKEEACMIGQLRVGTREIKEKKKGIVMDSGHYLGDGLWRIELD
ncbi:MAG: hypothetical protein Q9182_006051 [Xanthomendoza sp. 2 TL-2023]